MLRSQPAKRSNFFIFVFLFITFYSSVTVARFGGMSQQIKAEKISTPESGYLYLGTTDSYPINDYDGNHGASGRPDFLYSPDTGPRVVEFYAPWCPHVRRSKLATQAFGLSRLTSFLFYQID
jgi:hypothetical protein